MSKPSPTVCYPYEGVLYLAITESLEKAKLFKYGMTIKGADVRKDGHPGQMSPEKSRIICELYAPDARNAEAHAKAQFRDLGLIAYGQKELISGDLETAVAVLRSAVLNSRVRTAKPLRKAATSSRVHTCNPAWSCLLEYSFTIGKERKDLGAWLALALTDSRLSDKLEKLGIECTNCDSASPEFRLAYLTQPLETWLKSHDFEMPDLFTEHGAAEITASVASQDYH